MVGVSGSSPLSPTSLFLINWLKNKGLIVLTAAKAAINIRALFGLCPHYSALAQLVEQMTVNHWVAGSSPAGGATFKKAVQR